MLNTKIDKEKQTISPMDAFGLTVLFKAITVAVKFLPWFALINPGFIDFLRDLGGSERDYFDLSLVFIDFSGRPC
jgi:hypothetical protein